MGLVFQYRPQVIRVFVGESWGLSATSQQIFSMMFSVDVASLSKTENYFQTLTINLAFTEYLPPLHYLKTLYC
jgi:hypothetical protein